MADGADVKAERDETDEAAIDRALAILSEHFDAATVLASRFDPDDGSTRQTWRMYGNWFACVGHVRDFLAKRDTEVRVEARREMGDDD